MSDSLLNGAASGLYHLPPTQLVTIETAAERANYCVLKADIARHAAIETTLSKLGSDFRLPAWYGANFDALYDCLSDPGWHPSKGHVLIINGLAYLRADDPGDFATLIEVLQAVADAWCERQQGFWILIDVPARGIPTFPEA